MTDTMAALVRTNSDGTVSIIDTTGAERMRLSGDLSMSARSLDQKWLPIGFRGRSLPGSGVQDTGATNNSFMATNAWWTPKNQDVIGLRLAFARHDATASGEVDRATTVTGLTAAINYGSVQRPVFFNGSRAVSVTPGRGVLLSDPIELYIPRNTQFFVRLFGSFSGALNFAGGANETLGQGRLTGEAGQVGVSLTDNTLNTTAPTNSGNGYFGPSAIYAQLSAASPALLIGGDSITYGSLGDTPDSYGNSGYILRSLTNTVPCAFLPRGSSSAAQYAARADGLLAHALEHGITDFLNLWGRNDIQSNSRTSAQLKTDLATISAPYLAAGVRVWVATIPPTTSSTDSWATVANQTISSAPAETQRLAYNADIRATYALYGYAGVIDLAAVVEDSGSPGKWRAAYTNDGVHPNATGHQALVNAGIVASSMFSP